MRAHTRDYAPCAVMAAWGNWREEVGATQTDDADTRVVLCMRLLSGSGCGSYAEVIARKLGASEGNRTPTPARARDFESRLQMRLGVACSAIASAKIGKR